MKLCRAKSNPFAKYWKQIEQLPFVEHVRSTEKAKENRIQKNVLLSPAYGQVKCVLFLLDVFDILQHSFVYAYCSLIKKLIVFSEKLSTLGRMVVSHVCFCQSGCRCLKQYLFRLNSVLTQSIAASGNVCYILFHFSDSLLPPYGKLFLIILLRQYVLA